MRHGVVGIESDCLLDLCYGNVMVDGETIEIPDMVKLATFYDPDGNSLMLFQLMSEQ